MGESEGAKGEGGKKGEELVEREGGERSRREGREALPPLPSRSFLLPSPGEGRRKLRREKGEREREGG